MAIPPKPRSVSDATRFTSATPHATSRADGPRFQPPSSGGRSRPAPPSSSSQPPRPPGGDGPSAVVNETPEQRVARLRAAHLAAKNAQVSQLDRLVAGSRRLFDSSHRFTVYILIAATGVIGLGTVYTAYDMLSYNRRRKREFVAAQQQLEADSLAAARLAFMRGQATEEQAAMVEAARARGEGEGGGGGPGGSFFQVPSLLGAPTPATPGTEASAASAAAAAAATQKASASTSEEAPTPTSAEPPAPASASSGGLRSWFRSALSRQEQGEAAGSSQRRLGYESLSEEDDGQLGASESDLVRAVEERQAYLTAKARQALERERANQRQGGPLDRLGLEGAANASSAAAAAAAANASGKKAWWWFW